MSTVEQPGTPDLEQFAFMTSIGFLFDRAVRPANTLYNGGMPSSKWKGDGSPFKKLSTLISSLSENADHPSNISFSKKTSLRILTERVCAWVSAHEGQRDDITFEDFVEKTGRLYGEIYEGDWPKDNNDAYFVICGLTAFAATSLTMANQAIIGESPI